MAAWVNPDLTPTTPSVPMAWTKLVNDAGDRLGHRRLIDHGREGGDGHRPHGQSQLVLRAALRALAQAVGIGVVGVGHSEPAGSGVHLHHEGGHAAGVPTRQHVGEVIGRVHHQAVEELPLA